MTDLSSGKSTEANFGLSDEELQKLVNEDKSLKKIIFKKEPAAPITVIKTDSSKP